LTHNPSPFYCSYFLDWVSCFAWADLGCNLPICASLLPDTTMPSLLVEMGS
jgi:hypothetical protein